MSFIVNPYYLYNYDCDSQFTFIISTWYATLMKINIKNNVNLQIFWMEN